MDLMTRFGGRKFLMALVVVGAAMFLEMRSDKGLTPTMAAFLAGIVGTFSVANYATTAKHMGSKKSQNEPQPPAIGMPQEQVQGLVNVLEKLSFELNEVKETALQTGKAVVALGNRRQ